ncbi:hypothetical protein I6A84_00205, partial [Frankia sp. CNm7]|nr:hypothetical protein [Frankia nepalensis]
MTDDQPSDLADPDDPFAGLVLDEAFVRAASVYEAPARSRLAVRRELAGAPGAPSRRRRRSRPAPPGPPPAP